MQEKRIAILAIQETHLSEARVNLLNSQFNRRLKIWNSTDSINPNNGKGIAIILNKQLTSWKEAVIKDIILRRALLMSLPWHRNSIVNVLAVRIVI